MGLFDRKYCSICGEKIGLLGNRKLEDGNMCKKCASRLSPWFSDRRHSTLDEIRAQLEYRENNRADVDAFCVTRTFGGNTKVYLDEPARRFMVTGARNLSEANPDVISCERITDCRVDVNETRHELRRADKDGRQVSYDPPRYEYSYDFYLLIRVNHPYIDEIRFKLNSGSVKTGERSINDVRARPQRPATVTEAAVEAAVSVLAGIGRGPTWNEEYNEQLALASEIRDTLLELRRQGREEAAAQSRPPQTVTCPHCGAPTVPDAEGRCEYCGASLDL